MAKTSVATLITDLCTRMGWSSTDSTARADALRQLNIEERRISQPYSMLYLQVVDTTSVALANTASSVTLPTCDFGKPLTIVGLQFREIDALHEADDDTYGDYQSTRPGFWSVANTTATPPVPTIYFSRANTTGSTITYTSIYQRIVAALTDSSSSFSVLPEGYEDTLLLDSAEAELKRQKREPDAMLLLERVREARESLYGSYRTTKERPMTDREQIDRKTATDRLAHGA